jgi:2,3-bisphosphoglycerate-independent phosphoglycerate mutase
MVQGPVVLVILDGWGCAPSGPTNAISSAHTPHMDALAASSPSTRLLASGLAVGLPEGQIGNSEVSHLNIGAGYPVLQDLPRIDDEIANGRFFDNAALIGAARHAAASATGTLHLMGLYSDGGVHSHAAHVSALLGLARRLLVPNVALHLFLDGRDVPPRQALEDVSRLGSELAQFPGARIATVMGRFYAMDRDNRWDRVERAYAALADGRGDRFDSASAAIAASYAAGVSDEFMRPAIIGDPDRGRIRPGDAVVFFNFRADRARELTRALVDPAFEAFPRDRVPQPLHMATFASYDDSLPVQGVAFPPTLVDRPLARIVADAGLTQFHTAETEKYAHVTYFLNGGHERPFPGEERSLVPSPRVATYDLQPEMSAAGVAAEAVRAIRAGHDLVVVNFANPDMVGHTGDLDAAVRAIEAVDAAIGQIVAAVRARDGALLVTADHGNAEEMVDPSTGQPKTAHTTNPVPCILHGVRAARKLRPEGRLCDVAPTILELLGIPAPPTMTAVSLIER